LDLIATLLKDHQENQEDMKKSGGIQVVGFLLKQISPLFLTEHTISLFPKLVHIILDRNFPLYEEVVRYLLFDSKLWIYTKPNVQIPVAYNSKYLSDSFKQ